MASTAFALCCIFASCASPSLAHYGYGPNPASGHSRGGGSGYGGHGAFGGQSPISAAIRTMHHIDFVDVPRSSDNIKSATVEVGASHLPLNILFRSASSTLNLLHQHDAALGDFKESSSEDEPHRLYHTVKKPIIQEVYEIISPYRKITQKIEPVQEEIQTIISRQDGEQRVLEHTPKYVDNLTTLKAVIPMTKQTLPLSPSAAVRTESGSLIKVQKASYGDDGNKQVPIQQTHDDMYRSGSAPTYAMEPDFNHIMPLPLPPKESYSKYPMHRGKSVRKNRRMPPPPPKASEPNLPFNLYEPQYMNQYAQPQDSGKSSESSERNKITIHQLDNRTQMSEYTPSSPWSGPSTPSLPVYESFEGAFRGSNLNRYEPITSSEPQMLQNAEEDNMYDMMRFDLENSANSQGTKRPASANSAAAAAGVVNHRKQQQHRGSAIVAQFSLISDNKRVNLPKLPQQPPPPPPDMQQNMSDADNNSEQQQKVNSDGHERTMLSEMQTFVLDSATLADGREGEQVGRGVNGTDLPPPPPQPVTDNGQTKPEESELNWAKSTAAAVNANSTTPPPSALEQRK